jgi:hypothetical protein
MNRPALPEKGWGARNEVRSFICSLRSWCSKSLKGLLELAGTQPQKFEMRPVWGAKFFKYLQPANSHENAARSRSVWFIMVHKRC